MSNEEEEEFDESGEEFNEESEESSDQLEIGKETLQTIKIDKNLYKKLVDGYTKFVELSKEIIKENSKEYAEQEIQTDTIIEVDKTIPLKEEIGQLKIEIEVLKAQIATLTKDKQKITNDYTILKSQSRTKLENYMKEVTALKQKIKVLEETNESNKIKMVNMKPISKQEIVFTNEKLLLKILSYLPRDSLIAFSTLNHFFHNFFYYKTRCDYLEKKLNGNIMLLSKVTSQDPKDLYKIEANVAKAILEKYTMKHTIPGNCLRFCLIHALLFLENVIRNPLRVYHDKTFNEKEKGLGLGKLLSNAIKIITDDTQEDLQDKMDKQLDDLKVNELKKNYIDIPMDQIDNLKEVDLDNKILSYFNDKEKEINQRFKIQFEFENPEQIKSLLEFFFKSNLPKERYIDFNKFIIREFSLLLYFCFKSLEEIKQLEIANFLIDSRYKRMQVSCFDMEEEIKDLNKFIETSKSVKENMINQKTDLEIKYNDVLIKNSELIREKIKNLKTIEEIDKERSNCEKEFNEFKSEILEEVKQMKSIYETVVKERNLLKLTLKEFKNYFVNNVNNEGELNIN